MDTQKIGRTRLAKIRRVAGAERNLTLEDAISPLLERAKIAFLTFDQRIERHYQKWNGHAPYEEQQFPIERLDEYSSILNAGHPSRAEIKTAFRGLGLGKISHDELRSVIIRMFLRDTPEDTETEFEDLSQFQKLARVISGWIMDAFDDACWMTEEQAADWLASVRPHSIAG